MTKKILITGGAGCLGSNLAEKYLDEGHKVIVIDNFATGYREVVPEGVENLSVYEGSISDEEFVERVFDETQPTHVIHSAAAYKDPDDHYEDIATNITGSVNIVNACKKHNVKRLVNFQTALCYGVPDEVPIPVTHPVNPITSYGITKTAGEQFVSMSGLNYVSLRLASIIAPRLSIGVIPTFYSRIKEDKGCFCTDAVRDFMDISDFFTLMDLVIEEDASQGIYNVGPGEGHSIKGIYEVIAEYLGKSSEGVEVRPHGDDDIQTVILKPSETKSSFNWETKIGFKDTIRNMLRWYDKHGVSAIYTHLKS